MTAKENAQVPEYPGKDEHGGYSCADTERGHTAWMERALQGESTIAAARAVERKIAAMSDSAGYGVVSARQAASWLREALSASPAPQTTDSALLDRIAELVAPEQYEASRRDAAGYLARDIRRLLRTRAQGQGGGNG